MRCCAIALSLLLWSLTVQAGAPEKPSKMGKLETPTQVLCTKANEAVTVTWAPSAGASHYRVHLVAGTDDEAMDTIVAPPYTLALSELTDTPDEPITAQVRAMRSSRGRGASQPTPAVPCLAGPGPAPAPAPLPAR